MKKTTIKNEGTVFRILVRCPDQLGLIFKVSKILYNLGANIIQNGEFVDKNTKTFFMRSEIECKGYFNDIKQKLMLVLPQGSEVKVKKAEPKQLVILCTKESHCLGDLLLRHESGELKAKILAVIGNRKNLQSLVEKFSIPFHLISHENISRKEHEEKIAKAILSYKPDLIVLAKYMRIFSEDFISSLQIPLINIHHSFLPAFAGANPYKQAYERGVKIIGATAHLVVAELDAGPIIDQDVTHIDHNYSWQQMRNAGKYGEKKVLARALELILEDRVIVYNNKTVIL